MCLNCFDADERKQLLVTEECDAELSPFMTVEELKTKIVDKWHATKKTSHRVYKEAIIDPPQKTLQWTEVLNNKPVKLVVRFVHF
jgi:hypothetical protein